MKTIESIVDSKNIALLGVSRTGKKFGNMLMKDLLLRGYNVYPVHPTAKEVDGVKCYSSLEEIKGKTDTAVFCIKPAITEIELKNADKAGINKVWITQGGESPEALKYCEEHNIEEVHGRCMMMFLSDPIWMHKAHRFVLKMFGRMPSKN